jgi:hypothetical protein
MSVDDGLRALFRKHVPRPVDWQSVETGAVSRGVPDSNFCCPRPRRVVAGYLESDGTEGWIEYKMTKGFSVHLRPEQIGWITCRVRHGGRVFVAVRRRVESGARRQSADELHLVSGRHVRALAVGGLRSLPPGALAGLWTGGPSRWDWPAVRAALVAVF